MTASTARRTAALLALAVVVAAGIASPAGADGTSYTGSSGYERPAYDYGSPQPTTSITPEPGCGTRRPAPVKPRAARIVKGQDARFVVLKFAEKTDIRLYRGRFVSASGRFDTSGVNQALYDYGFRAAPKFRQPAYVLDRLRAQGARSTGCPDLPHLSLYFDLYHPRAYRTADLMNALNAQKIVEIAYAAPLPQRPPAHQATTPNYAPAQGYSGQATLGVDTNFANTLRGGNGSGVRIVDVERDWRFTHEDLRLSDSTLISGFKFTGAGNHASNDEHGTAVLGQLAALDNGVGVTGMVTGSSIRAASPCRDAACAEHDIAEAIVDATVHLNGLTSEDGIILVEQQATLDTFDLIPAEVYQAEFDAVLTAVVTGMVVVQAAGNGGEDLDGVVADGRRVFDRAVRNSGAIIVGAGCPGACNGLDDRDALAFSSHGERVDLQAWGRSIMTTGYGTTFGRDATADNPDRYYRSTFGGTSGASPIVTAAVAALQGRARQVLGRALIPHEVLDVLTESGSPQPADDAAVTPIGPRPNVRAALGLLERLPQAGPGQELTASGEHSAPNAGISGCPDGQYLVGIRGFDGWYVDSIMAECARVVGGSWQGDPSPSPAIGGPHGEAGYSQICPNDHAVSGFRGTKGWWIDSVQVGCRAIASNGRLTGETQWLTVAGGRGPVGAAAFGPLECGNNFAVEKLSGRWGDYMNEITMTCKAA